MRVAIMQPTYLPWCGYFDLIDRVDQFVFLDDVAFQKRSWQQRNRLVGREGLQWLTIPVKVKGERGQCIRDVKLAECSVLEKHVKTITSHYGRPEALSAVLESLGSFGREGSTSLCALNIRLVETLCTCLGIDTPLLRASEFSVGGQRGEHLARLCEATGSSVYVTPPGSEDYLCEDLASFSARSVSIVVQEYEHPVYEQGRSPFVSHASVVDLLACTGSSASAILRGGRRPSRRLRVDAIRSE